MTRPIAACRLVDMSILPSVPGLTVPIYPGSIVGACMTCARPVYIGPKIQEALQQEPQGGVLCYLCFLEIQEARGRRIAVHHLGNTFHRADVPAE